MVRVTRRCFLSERVKREEWACTAAAPPPAAAAAAVSFPLLLALSRCCCNVLALSIEVVVEARGWWDRSKHRSYRSTRRFAQSFSGERVAVEQGKGLPSCPGSGAVF